MSHRYPILLLVLLLVGCSKPGPTKIVDPNIPPPAPAASDAEAVSLKAIHQIGGRAYRDESAGDQIDFQGTGVTDDDLKHLAPLTGVTSLILAETKVTSDGLKHLAPLTKLRELNLFNCRGVTDAGLAHLGGFKELTFIDLGGTKITDAGMKSVAGLGTLRELGVSDTGLTDEGLRTLTPLRGLTR